MVSGYPGSMNFREAGVLPAFPPSIVAAIKALACEMPSRRGLPLARWSVSELRQEAIASGIVATISCTCSDLQTSTSGIANIGGACARSLQLGIRRQRKIIANGRKLIATGIANIRSVRRLIATGGLMMGRKTVIFLPRVRGVLERA